MAAAATARDSDHFLVERLLTAWASAAEQLSQLPHTVHDIKLAHDALVSSSIVEDNHGTSSTPPNLHAISSRRQQLLPSPGLSRSLFADEESEGVDDMRIKLTSSSFSNPRIEKTIIQFSTLGDFAREQVRLLRSVTRQYSALHEEHQILLQRIEQNKKELQSTLHKLSDAHKDCRTKEQQLAAATASSNSANLELSKLRIDLSTLQSRLEAESHSRSRLASDLKIAEADAAASSENYKTSVAALAVGIYLPLS
jgi:hypothetical protein